MSLSLNMIIMEVPLFDELSPEEQTLIEPYLVCRRVKAGSTIYRQGEHGNSICFVVEGELDVIKEMDNGQKARVATLRKGQAVGEMAIIDGYTRSATICARHNAAVLILKRSDFNRLVDEHPQLGIKILKGLARMLSANLRSSSNTLSELLVTA